MTASPRRLRVVASMSVLVAAAIAAVGCREGHTVSRGSPADLRAFGSQGGALDRSAHDPSISAAIEPTQPRAQFPATIAVVRVQGCEYHTQRTRTMSAGAFTIVTTRDVELDSDFDQWRRDPMIRGIVPINHLSLSADVRGVRDLRAAAARLGADMLLLYTLDSGGEVVHHVPEFSVLTLGLAPEGEARANCTASAILLDVHSGHTFAVAEASDEEKRLSSAWGSESNQVKALRAAERNAFKNLLKQLKAQWPDIVQEHSGPGQVQK